MKIGNEFFARQVLVVARDLLGRTLRRTDGKRTAELVITDTAAHEGGSPMAMRDGMNYSPGKIFVMPYRGRLFLNFATDTQGKSSCVCVRGGIAIDGHGRKVVLDGPAKLATYLGVTEADDRTDVGKLLRIDGDPMSQALVEETRRTPKGDNCIATFSLRL